MKAKLIVILQTGSSQSPKHIQDATMFLRTWGIPLLTPPDFPIDVPLNSAAMCQFPHVAYWYKLFWAPEWAGRAWRLFIVHTASSTIILVFSLWEATSHLQIFHLSLLPWSLGALQVLSTTSLADLTLLCPGPVLGVFISSLYWCHTRWLSCHSVLSYQKKVIKTQESASTNTSHLLVSNWHNLCNSLISTSLATL